MVQYTNAANPDQNDFYFDNGQMKTDLRDQKMSGFVSWTGAGNYYSVASTTFTLLRGGTGYIKGDYVEWSGSQSTASLVAGTLNWVYIDANGTIGSTSTFSSSIFTDNIPLFEVLVDASSDVIVVKENHPYGFPTLSSLYDHQVIGVVIGGGGAEITLSGTDEIQIVGADTLYDHGLNTAISDSGGSPVTWSYFFTNGVGKWDKDSSATAFLSEYNNAGTMTALSAGKYGVWRLYVSKDDLNSSTPTYYAVAHTAQFNNLTQAQNAIATGVAEATNELLNLELAQLGYVIYEESSSEIVDVIIEKATLKGTTIGASNANNASLIVTDTTNFDNNLSAADTTVQAALDTIDDLSIGGAGTYPNMGVTIANKWNTGNTGITFSTYSATDGRLIFSPLYFTSTFTITNIGVRVTGAVAGSTVRIGLFTFNSATGDLTLVADGGNVSTAATAMAITSTITTTLDTSKKYFVGFLTFENAGSVTYKSASNFFTYYNSVSNSQVTALYIDGQTASSPFSASYAFSGLSENQSTAPVVLYN